MNKVLFECEEETGEDGYKVEEWSKVVYQGLGGVY